VILAINLIVVAGLHLTAQTAVPPGASMPAASSVWTLGLARFGQAKAGQPPSILQETLPRLIVADLSSLPTRHTPDAAAAETAALASLRARFAAGVDLASKLDARSARFFAPSLEEYAKKADIATADKQVAASSQKLSELDSGKSASIPPPIDRAAKLWDGHANGQLIDIPSSGLSQAAKAAAVDLLVTGTVSLQSGYAIVVVRGFDAILEREVFSWKTFCSVDDPAPLAADIAERLELWVAGRAFARVEVRVNPASAELRVNDELHEKNLPVFYIYQNGKVRLEATASGYATRVVEVDLELGDRKSLDIALEPLSTGIVNLSTDPTGASISLDSVPIGQSPISIKLDGGRGIANVSAKGREPQDIVLPNSGDSKLNVNLQPVDSLGPSGRLSAAKDRFYESLGWFVLSIPATTLTAGVFGDYYDAYARSGAPSMYTSRNVAAAALAACAIATGVTATIMIIRLVKYLKAAH
jgi:hypothetical protein